MTISDHFHAIIYCGIGLMALILSYWVYRRLPIAKSDSNLGYLCGYIDNGVTAYLNAQRSLSLAIVGGMAAVPFLYGFRHSEFFILSAIFLTGAASTAVLSWVAVRISTRGAMAVLTELESDTGNIGKTSMKAGTGVGIAVASISLLAVVAWTSLFRHHFLNFYGSVSADSGDMLIVLAFALGGLVQALISRISGGLFFQMSDLASKTVGNLEFDLGENTFKNAGSLSRYIGMHVGKVATAASGAFETFSTSVAVCVMILIAIGLQFPNVPVHQGILVILHLTAIGVFSSLIGLLGATFLRRRISSPFGLFSLAYLISVVLIQTICYFLLYEQGLVHWSALVSIGLGLIVGLLGIGLAYFFTAKQSAQAEGTANSALNGALHVILSGISRGLLATVLMGIVAITVALIVFDEGQGSTLLLDGMFNISLAALAIVLPIGPLTGFAGVAGISATAAGMSATLGYTENPRRPIAKIDADGNTISTAVDTIFAAATVFTGFPFVMIYIRKIRYWIGRILETGLSDFHHGHFANSAAHPHQIDHMARFTTGNVISLYELNILNPDIIGGMVLGGIAVFLTTALILHFLLRGSRELIGIIRSELRQNPGIWEGEALPDYTRFVTIAARYAHRNLIWLLGICAVCPIGVGLWWGVPGVTGFLMGLIGIGFLFTLFFTVTGGLWLAARHRFSMMDSELGSPIHINLTVGEGMGTIFRDALAPILSGALKLMALICILSAGVAILGGFLF